jgi:transposase
MRQRKPYPSDISLEQFAQIRPLLESVRKRTKPTTVNLYEVFNALLYLLKSGCQWRMLPEGFPKWCTVYSYFAKWREPDRQGASALERALKNLLARPAPNWGATPRPALLSLTRRV